MALGLNSYGDTAEIASRVPRHANAATLFDASTRPTLNQVENFCDELSAMLNVMMANVGFDVPITQADAKKVLDLFVNEIAAERVKGVNGYGHFGPTTGKGRQPNPMSLMMDAIHEFINKYAAGFERLGAVRDFSLTAGLAFRDTDESGNAIHPIFQRSAHGNRFTNWDSE